MQTTQPRLWTRDQIIDLLNTSNEAVEKAIVRLYQGQTSQEQDNETTYDHNQIGFNAYSAKAGTYYAKWVLGHQLGRSRSCSGRHLTGDFLTKARKIALRHVKQLTAFANRPYAAWRQQMELAGHDPEALPVSQQVVHERQPGDEMVQLMDERAWRHEEHDLFR